MSGERPLVIAGGGLAGCLTALALAKLRPELPILLVEQELRFGGNHVWSFFDSDVAPGDRWLVDPFVAARWDSYDVRFPERARTLATGYNSSRSELLDPLVHERLPASRYRLGQAITEVTQDAVTVGGERIEALAVIDARGAAQLAALDLGWQKFVGRDYRTAAPHGLDRPIVMDACVDQSDGYRFVYCLPFAEDRLLIEDTYYTEDPNLQQTAIGARIEAYAAAQGWQLAAMEKEEVGVLPVAMGGDFDAFWPAGDGQARIGLRGGFFHPTTGYSLPDAVRLASAIARAPDLSPPALARLTRAHADRAWKARGFYRMLDAMLFRAAEPAQRYRVLERFYRLPEPLIGRFYAAQSTKLDKLRILTGKPPVPIGRAVRAILKGMK